MDQEGRQRIIATAGYSGFAWGCGFALAVAVIALVVHVL